MKREGKPAIRTRDARSLEPVDELPTEKAFVLQLSRDSGPRLATFAGRVGKALRIPVTVKMIVEREDVNGNTAERRGDEEGHMWTREGRRVSDPRWRQFEQQLAKATESENVSVTVVVNDEASAYELWGLLTDAERARISIQWTRIHFLSGHPLFLNRSQPPPVQSDEDVTGRDLTYD